MLDGAELPSAVKRFGQGWAGARAYHKNSILATIEVQLRKETKRQTRERIMSHGARAGMRSTHCWREVKERERKIWLYLYLCSCHDSSKVGLSSFLPPPVPTPDGPGSFSAPSQHASLGWLLAHLLL